MPVGSALGPGALILDRLAAVFNDDLPAESTLADVSLLENTLNCASRQQPKENGRTQLRPASVATPAGGVFVHSRRTHETIPSFGAPPRCGIATVDAEFDRRAEQLMREMRQSYSDFSLNGLGWAEQQVQADAAIRAERAAEDAEIARQRLLEDAERTARREQQDAEREHTGKRAESVWCSERDVAEAALAMEWKTKWAELTAALEERFAAHQAQMALDEQRAREEEARVRQEAAAAAAAAAEQATRETEALEGARKEAELSRLRSSLQPSIASLGLVSAAAVPATLGYSGATVAALRKDDRSWWRCLHFLEAEGLTPPLKGSAVATALFDALDVDADGAIPLAEAGYALALLGGGSARERVDAACGSRGAPAAGAEVTLAQATSQLELCAKVRLHCGPIVQALHLKAQPAGVAATGHEPALVPTTPELKQQLAALYASAASLPAERFRSWAATTCVALFSPLL
eukprot:Transcript_16906.p1 GENE.Transcript_16906~~Transcript_16906.p1  ORF type:complete len:464 (+),score=158.53 Transcript_16906:87-1478(+)